MFSLKSDDFGPTCLVEIGRHGLILDEFSSKFDSGSKWDNMDRNWMRLWSTFDGFGSK